MNKRSFIKRFSGMLAGPAVSPLFALVPDSKLKNWAGNVDNEDFCVGVDLCVGSGGLPDLVEEFAPKVH